MLRYSRIFPKEENSLYTYLFTCICFCTSELNIKVAKSSSLKMENIWAKIVCMAAVNLSSAFWFILVALYAKENDKHRDQWGPRPALLIPHCWLPTLGSAFRKISSELRVSLSFCRGRITSNQQRLILVPAVVYGIMLCPRACWMLHSVVTVSNSPKLFPSWEGQLWFAMCCLSWRETFTALSWELMRSPTPSNLTLR